MAESAEKKSSPASEKPKSIVTQKSQISEEMQRAVSFLQKGSMLTKVRSVGRHYQRYYFVDTSSLTLRYADSRKCWTGFSRGSADQSRIAIKQIAEIRESTQQENPQLHAVPSFTLVVGEQMKTLSLIAPRDDVRDLWVSGLRFLVNARLVDDPVKQERMWLQECFANADKNRDTLLDKEEIICMLKSLNVSSEISSYVKERASKQKLSADDFVAIYQEFSKRKELEELFNRYANDQMSMNISELSEFFKIEEQQNLGEKELVEVIASSEQCPNLKSQNLLSLAGFNVMFSLPLMRVKQPRCRTVYQDMTQPLSHYFINSSHNTYLEGHQLVGTSSAQQYGRVLTHRCRCVELDVWDGDDDEPIIYHGYTLTSKIFFKDALKAINKRAFKKSEYPVILSIENHCSVEQQVRMAEHLKHAFGSKLLVEPLPEGTTTLPSPEQLKGRVIVKGKKLPVDSVDGDLCEEDSDEAAEIEDEEVQKRVKQSKNKAKSKVAPEFSDCIVICQAVSFKSFEESAKKTTFVNMSSFSEDKAMKLAEGDSGRAYVKHNKWQLSRIYPAGTRIDSSNYDPVPMWMAGCQIVALNYQTRDDPLMLNYGFFEDNGASGYVLKPEFMTSKASEYSPSGSQPVDWARVLTVRVISGYMLPKKPGDSKSSILDPYVRVEVHGVAADNSSSDTEVVSNNGFNPRWNETKTFTVTCPQLAVVMWRVLDKSDTVAQYAVPMRCLQTGFRMVELRDMKGERLGPTGLFVHISIGKLQP